MLLLFQLVGMCLVSMHVKFGPCIKSSDCRHKQPPISLADLDKDNVSVRYTNCKSTLPPMQGENYEVPIKNEKQQLDCEVLDNEDEHIYEVPKDTIDSTSDDCTAMSNPTYEDMTADPDTDDDTHSNMYCEMQAEDEEVLYEET